MARRDSDIVEPTWLACAAAGALLAWGWRRRRKRQLAARRDAFINRFRFPQRLAQQTRSRYPHLQTEDLHRVERGLRQYFRLCHRAGGQMVSMPSQVVDAMWHAWILDTRAYQRFCQQAFGRFLHHTPAEAMPSPARATAGIRLAWRLACADEGLAPRRPQRVPLVFALDRELRIPDGFFYVPDCRAAGASAGGALLYCGSDIGCAGGGDGTGWGGDSHHGGDDGGAQGGAEGCGGSAGD